MVRVRDCPQLGLGFASNFTARRWNCPVASCRGGPRHPRRSPPSSPWHLTGDGAVKSMELQRSLKAMRHLGLHPHLLVLHLHRSQLFRIQMQSCDRRGFADPTLASDILEKFAESDISLLRIERVRAGLHLLPLEGAGLVDPEGNFVHQNQVVGADLVDAAGVGMAGGGLGHAAGMIVDGAMGGAGPGHAAGMVVDGAMGGAGPGHAAGMVVDGPGHAAGMVVDGPDAGGAGLMHAPDMIVGSEAVGVDLVNAAGMGVGFAGVVEGAAADAGLVDAAGMYDPQVGVAGGTGTVDAAMQHHIDRVSEIIESEDVGAVLDDLPQQEAVAVGPMNLDLLSVNQPPQ